MATTGRRTLRVGALAIGALLLAGCAVDATVTVAVREDGTGTVAVDVRADPAAVQMAEAGGGSLETRVRVADLAAAGWTVAPWVRAPDGSATLVLTRRFARVDEVPGILRALNGDAGPLVDARFTRDRGFFATRFGAAATLDPAVAGTGVADDAELTASLLAQGVDLTVLEERLRTQIRDGVRVRLVVELPGRDPVTVATGSEGAVTLDESTQVWNRTRIAGLAGALGLVVLAGVVARRPRTRRVSPPASGRRTPPAS